LWHSHLSFTLVNHINYVTHCLHDPSPGDLPFEVYNV
jgi:hypothetical protein